MATQHDYMKLAGHWEQSERQVRAGEGGKDDPATTFSSHLWTTWEKNWTYSAMFGQKGIYLINAFHYPTDYKDELKNNQPSLLPPPLKPGVWFMGSTQQGVGATPSAPLIL